MSTPNKLQTERTQRRKGAKKGDERFKREQFRAAQFRSDFAAFLRAFAPLRETSPTPGVNHV
jgi:hypothetical protein